MSSVDAPGHPNRPLAFSRTPLRLHYNTEGGVQFTDDSTPRRTTKRQWRWSGEPHVHAPPFQPILLQLNTCLAVRIVDRARIHVHYQHGEQHCRIDVSISPSASSEQVVQPLRVLMFHDNNLSYFMLLVKLLTDKIVHLVVYCGIDEICDFEKSKGKFS